MCYCCDEFFCEGVGETGVRCRHCLWKARHSVEKRIKPREKRPAQWLSEQPSPPTMMTQNTNIEEY